MSKLILDFNLSDTPQNRRRLPSSSTNDSKVARPASVSAVQNANPVAGTAKKPLVRAKNTLQAKTTQENPASNAVSSGCAPVLGNVLLYYKVVLTALLLITVFSVAGYATLGLSTHSEAARRKIVPASCSTHKNYLVCHGETCLLKGGCLAQTEAVFFDSVACANAVLTLTLHDDSGVAKKYPAHYFRQRNTTSFHISGKRPTFSPMLSKECKGRVKPVAYGRTTDDVITELRGAFVWVASEKFAKYSVYNDNKLIASMDEDMVLVSGVGKFHYVYRFDPACRHWDEITDALVVYGETDTSRQKVKTFVYCE